MASQSCLFLSRSLTRALSTFRPITLPTCNQTAVPGFWPSLTSPWLGCQASIFEGGYVGGLDQGFGVRRWHGRRSSLSEDELEERVRLAVRAGASRKTGGGRPKVRRKRSIQWAPPAGTSGSDDLIESELVLRHDQALGQVVTSQANFMRVLVEKTGAPEATTAVRVEATAGWDAVTAGGNGATGGKDAETAAGKPTTTGKDGSIGSGGAATAGMSAAPAGGARTGSELLCVVRALLKKIRKRVLVGDRVLVSSIDWVEGRGMIEEVVKRKSELEDPPIANVDHFLVLFALARPPLEPIQLSRFLVAAEYAGVPFTLALNKADLAPPGAAAAWRARLEGWGYNAHILSVEGGEGLEGVFHELSGKTTVVAGPSGAGKSSLINRLRTDSARLAAGDDVSSSKGDVSGSSDHVSGREGDVSGRKDDVSSSAGDVSRSGGDVSEVGGPERKEESVVSRTGGAVEGAEVDTLESLAVSAVSEKSGLGRHTTRSIVLIRLPLGGLLADTPGFSLPALSRITEQELPHCFPEIRQRLAAAHAAGLHCAYKDCKHLAEPDCVVSGRQKRSDVEGNGSVMVVEGPDGSLEEREVFEMQEGFVPWERYEDYKQLMAEVKEREDKERWAFGTKRESAVRVRKTDGATGKPKVEPRLAPQKHRRESRKLAKQGLEGLLKEEEEEEMEEEENSNGNSSARGFRDETRQGRGMDAGGSQEGTREKRKTELGASDGVHDSGERSGEDGDVALAFEENKVDVRASRSQGGSRGMHMSTATVTVDEVNGSAGSSGSTESLEGSNGEERGESGEANAAEPSHDEADGDVKDWLDSHEFQYKWWEDNDAHLNEDPRLASSKSTRGVRRHWRLRQAKVVENREAVFGKPSRD